ncbi:MAG: polymer-forming cytoskeletal protein [Magnetospirillum sp. WYHS-4]
MFSKSSKPSAKAGAKPPVQPARAATPSIISTDLRIVGDLNSDGEIQVDGAVDGDIRSRVLLVGETAHIKGEIIADAVRVHGHVNGQIKANTVSLATTAHVIGDILHENLSIEKGAFLEGHCRRMNERVDLSEGAGKITLLLKGTEQDILPIPEKA